MKVTKGKAYTRVDSPFVWIRFSADKKPYRKKTKFLAKDIEYVEKEYLPLIIAKIKSGEIILEKVDKKSFKYYSQLFLKGKEGLKPNTKKIYAKQIKFWDDAFENIDIRDIKPSKIKELILSLGVSIDVKRNLLNRCKGVFDEALADEVIPYNPCERVKLSGSKKKKKIFPFSADEVKLILDNADSFFKNYLAVGFYTGIRTGELLALKWQNVDFRNRRIYINCTIGDYEEQETKTSSGERYVPIFEPLVPYLKEQQKINGMRERVFCTSTGRHYGTSNLTIYFWKPLLKRLHIPYRRMYETRHTFATNMLESNQFSLNQIAKWLGHADIQSLIKTYNNYIPSEIAKYDDEFDVFSTKVSTSDFKSA